MLNRKALSATAQVEKDGDFKQTVLLLHGDGTNGAQNNTFTDSSTNNFTITRNGNTTQGAFSPFSVGASEWSNHFDGTGDYLTVPASADFAFGTGDFTVECWVYWNTVETQVFVGNITNGGADDWAFHYLGGGTDELRFVDGVGNYQGYSWSPTANTWYHVAVSRSGTDLRFFVNGALLGTASNSSDIVFNGTNLYVGSSNQGTLQFNGYISNLRVVKGTAVYTAAFTVPTTPLTAITNTKFLTCQSNRFVDNSASARTITVAGNPSVQAFSPFAPTAAYSAGTNGGSGYFDGTGDTISVASNTAFSFGTGDFTIEAWIYPTSLANAPGFTDTRAVSGDSGYAWYIQFSSLFLYTSGNDVLSGGITLKTNTWTHIALVRNGSTISQYVNGVLDVSATYSGSMTCPGSLVIAGWYTASTLFTGYISNYRLVKGTAVYTSAFTPPTSPVTAITNTNLLCNFTNAGIIDSTAKNNLETVDNAQIDTTTKKFGTGSMKFDGTGDYLVAPASSINSLGSGDFTVEGWFRTASASTLQSIVNIWSSSPTQFQIEINASGNIQCSWAPYSTAAYLITGSTAISANTWYHFAFVRNGSTFTLYLNGTSDGTGTSSATTTNNAPLYIGINNGSSLNRAFNGYIDDLRITKGVARYTANFTAPTKAFADQ